MNRILLLNAVNNINRGMEPGLQCQVPSDLSDEEKDVKDGGEFKKSFHLKISLKHISSIQTLKNRTIKKRM